jgi:ubiquinone biosynthesis protein COQ9
MLRMIVFTTSFSRKYFSRYLGLRLLCSDTNSFSVKSETNSDSDWSSDGDDSCNESVQVNKKSIMKAALTYVPTYGWTYQSLALGAKTIGLPGTVHGMFEHGPIELVDYFSCTANEQLAEFMSGQQNLRAKTSVFLQDVITARLTMIIPYIHNWPQALTLMAVPSNAPKSFAIFLRMVDDIWHSAGDRSTYFSWYTKRIILATIYSSTELYMLQDKSAGYQNTWHFLERQISALSQSGVGEQKCEDGSESAENIAHAVKNFARNIVSMNVRHR